MAIAGIYRKILPSPPAIDFSSFQGKKFFSEALQSGNMEGFFNLISYFQTQSEPAYCGLASLSMVLNALGIDSGKKWKGPWRWFDESMLDCCEPLEKIKNEGITFGKVACLAHCAGARVEAFRSDQSTIDDFRKYVKACTSSDDCHLITSYHRAAFKQTGSGHFSPVGGYHTETDMALILDVARFKYPPHWVPLTLLWEAMGTVDESTGHHRGFMLISRLQAPSLLYTLSCKHESWISTVKYLMDDVPSLVKSEDVRDVEKVLSVVFTSLPTNFTEFIKWVAEARRQEDGASSKEEKGRLSVKEEVLKQMRETGLFIRVQEWISSVNICCRSISSLGDKDTLPEIAAGNPGSSYGCLCSISCVKCLKVNGNTTPITMVSGTVVTHESKQEVENLVPFSLLKSNCRGADPSTCTGMLHPASNDVLTALLLALPPKTWSGIIEEKISQEICSLLATEHLPSLLQEAVLHLRRQLHFLKKCQEKKSVDHLCEPTTH